MPLNPQTHNFPPMHQMEQSWASNLEAVMRYLMVGQGWRHNANIGIPLSGGQPTTGLVPTMDTAGTMVGGDEVLQIYKQNMIPTQANWTNKKLFFGLKKMYFADNPEKPTDTVVAEVSTDNLVPASIMAIAMPMNYGAVQFGVTGVINLAKCVKGADVNLFTWNKPADVGLPYVRIEVASVETAIAATANNAAGDDFLLKAGGQTLVTHPAAALSTVGTITAGLPSAGTGWVFNANNLVFRYNQTDAAPAITGGLLRFSIKFECF